jgi:predicted transcriptional regulator
MIRPRLSSLEQIVMDIIWAHPGTTAESCREALAASSRPLKESTVRTVLHRLEKKGYVTHKVDGRTYRYSAREPRRKVAVQAVRQIIDRFCDGSVEQLLAGMVDHKLVDRRELQQLARKIAAAEKERRNG